MKPAPAAFTQPNPRSFPIGDQSQAPIPLPTGLRSPISMLSSMETIEQPWLISKNPTLKDQYEKVPRMAKCELPVLILGPSGSGKEKIARSIHFYSNRRPGPFVSLNCSALVESIAESELFGHTRGSFTGASADRKGAFESARKGTLFLDEIGDLPLSLQAKLLRALENKEIRPVGSDRTIETDVRIVAATHQDLQEKIKKHLFRADLFYRLNVLQISTRSLRERMEDFDDIAMELGSRWGVVLTEGTIAHLKRLPWPGNIRELQNMISRLAAFFPGETIDDIKLQHVIGATHSPLRMSETRIQGPRLPKYKAREKALIIEVLTLHFGNQRKAAADLGMPKSTFHDRIKTYDINPREFLPARILGFHDERLDANGF